MTKRDFQVMRQFYIGIDPGATGALACLCNDGSFYSVVDFDEPMVCLSLLRWFSPFYVNAVDADGQPVVKESSANSGDMLSRKSVIKLRILIEKQQAMPKQGVSSMFKIGTNYGIWLGRLEALGLAYEIVTPTKWKKTVFDSMPRQVDKKAMSLDLARRLWPSIADEYLRCKKDHNRAEALLIAEAARRMHSGTSL